METAAAHVVQRHHTANEVDLICHFCICQKVKNKALFTKKVCVYMSFSTHYLSIFPVIYIYKKKSFSVLRLDRG